MKKIELMISKILSEMELNRLIKYTLGMIVIGFGVTLMIKSTIGLSSWDTLHFSLHKLFGITIGGATILVATTFTIFVILINRDHKYLLMSVPIIGVGLLIDLFNLTILGTFEPILLWYRMLIYLFGLLLLPLGGALLISSSYPAGVFDEFMLGLARRLKTDKVITIRVIMELTAVLTALVLGLIAGIGLGQINIGTLIFSLTVGPLVKFYLTQFEKMGIYKNKQMNATIEVADTNY